MVIGLGACFSKTCFVHFTTILVGFYALVSHFGSLYLFFFRLFQTFICLCLMRVKSIKRVESCIERSTSLNQKKSLVMWIFIKFNVIDICVTARLRKSLYMSLLNAKQICYSLLRNWITVCMCLECSSSQNFNQTVC